MEEVTIHKDHYEELLRDQEKLGALEAGGVDNWEWYSESLADWYKKYYPDEYEDEDEED